MTATTKVIIGFNKTAKGKTIHAIIEGGIALCDKRIHLTINDDEPLAVKDVTCPKCLVYSEVKKAREALGITDTVPKPTSVPKPKAPKPKVKVKPKEKKVKPKPKPKSRPKTKAKTEVKAKAKKPWAFLRDKKRKTKCQIIHLPTGQVFFENIKTRFAKPAVKQLNEMEIRWEDKNDPVPKKFVKTAKAIVIDIIEGKDKGKKETKRGIKRRGEKKGKKKIKRRKQSEELHPITEMFGRRKGSPGFDIVLLLEEGASFRKMTSKLVKKHSIPEKKAKARVKGIIRKTIKHGSIIQATFYKNEERNFYQLTNF